eukprot:CAMPEP_0178428224 /NCGR_PEP_ID=MMETSP0689_2-20121128/30165_1 /TAXON_ID=160604 /ORGANISM="Amphidinium massartii, Strain CS-259" /LENGTH=300 /DNA_ID=CAMNT_0020049985 /DNA_START=88 /DNA_END=990 /DNA_ORIENTATION=-
MPAVLVAFTALLAALSAFTVGAQPEDPCVEVYFGSGCFWHVQHEFIKAEEEILGRTAAEYTSLTGYAGGTRAGTPQPCYGNYEQLGHTEVVRVLIPVSQLKAFADVFWSLFVNYDRVDTMDIGPDYRAAIGIAGGMNSPHFEVLRPADTTWNLQAGQGNDADTLGQPLVWVYDIESYPFFQAEVYHQFHDDFMPGGQYPQSYNDHQGTLLSDCRMRPTGCWKDQATPPSSCASLTPEAAGSCAAEPTPMWMPGGSTSDISAGGSGGSGWSQQPVDSYTSGGSRLAVLPVAVAMMARVMLQ